jgi:hypothetical protein
MTGILYEVFPVTVVAKQPIYIRHPQGQKCPPWTIPHQPNRHPNDVIVQYLITFFGDIIDLRHTIVHSTSWRYEYACDHIFLTYLAVLPQGAWVEQWVATNRIDIEPIGTVRARHGKHYLPPDHLEQHEVLAHALDHLASLSTYDPSIQETLEPAWETILRPRYPKPAGCLQRRYQSQKQGLAERVNLPGPLPVYVPL